MLGVPKKSGRCRSTTRNQYQVGGGIGLYYTVVEHSAYVVHAAIDIVSLEAGSAATVEELEPRLAGWLWRRFFFCELRLTLTFYVRRAKEYSSVCTSAYYCILKQRNGSLHISEPPPFPPRWFHSRRGRGKGGKWNNQPQIGETALLRRIASAVVDSISTFF